MPIKKVAPHSLGIGVKRLFLLIFFCFGCTKGGFSTGTFTENLSPGPFAATAQPSNGSITITWTKSDLAKKYSVSYGTTSGQYPVTISDDATSPFTLVHMIPNQNYYINVTATNDYGKTSAAEISATPTWLITQNLISTATQFGFQFDRMQLSSPGQRNVYIEFLHAGAGTPKPTIVITFPYDGIDWSWETIDQNWALLPNATTTTINTADIQAPGYNPNIPDYITYHVIEPMHLVNESLYWLYSGFNVVGVYNRFYAGATFDVDAFDTAITLKYLSTHPEVNANSISVYGGSWGAMVGAFGVVQSGVHVDSLVLATPLLDFPGTVNYYDTTLPTTIMSSTQKLLFANFWFPYKLRIEGVMNSTSSQLKPTTTLLSAGNLATKLDALTNHIYMYADDWDSIIPDSLTKSFAASLPASKTNAFFWGHATSLNKETMTVGHSQTAEPLITSAQFALDEFEITSNFLGSNANVFYIVNDAEWWSFLSHVRAQQLRGQDISGLLSIFKRIAGANVTVQDQSNATYNNISGANFLNAVFLIIWGANIPAANVLSYLQTNGFPP